MTRIYLVLGLILFAVALGCVDNEQSFYIEHMKAPPDPPECTTSIGDAKTSALGVNLMLAGSPGSSFQATNALISREDYGNLRAESNGIMIEGYELYTMVPGLGVVGGTAYYEYNLYLSPETTDLVHSTVMTSETTDTLRRAYDCEYYSPSEVADAIFYTHMRDYYQQRGDSVSAETLQLAARGDAVKADLVDTLPIPETMYSYVRFLGHSQGGKEVETPEFTVVIEPWCGVKGGWEPCFDNMCGSFCNDEAAYAESCESGVNAKMTCFDYLAGISYSIVSSNDDGTQITRDACDFFNCP